MNLRVLLALGVLASTLGAQVTYKQLLRAEQERGNWLTYSGGYRGWRYSSLDQISRQNVSRLKVKWVYQRYCQVKQFGGILAARRHR